MFLIKLLRRQIFLSYRQSTYNHVALFEGYCEEQPPEKKLQDLTEVFFMFHSGIPLCFSLL